MSVIKINIEKGTKIGDLQKAFSSAFPFLKMEPAPEFARMGTYTRIADILTQSSIPFVLQIDGKSTIAELETDLLNRLQIPFHVMRQSGSMWISTTFTKDWTLEHQNKEAELFSNEQHHS